jgi:hypothetical protein
MTYSDVARARSYTSTSDARASADDDDDPSDVGAAHAASPAARLCALAGAIAETTHASARRRGRGKETRREERAIAEAAAWLSRWGEWKRVSEVSSREQS